MPKITSKGQVTIPIEIRDQLGLHPGTEVEFEVEDGGVRMRTKRRGIDDWLEHVERNRHRWSLTGLTTDEIMALTRGED
jgi:AbrB family looped-hinge helix DNA binding protein